MNTFQKIILATFAISTLGLGGLAASASIKNSPTHPTISQRDKNTQIAEASDGDGEMNDAVEAELERKTQPENPLAEASDGDGEMNDALEAELEQKTQTENPSTRVNEVNKTQEVSQDKDGGDETREISDEPNDTDRGNETQETH